MESNFNKIYETSNPIDAQIIKQVLEENGIEAVTLNKRDSSYQLFGLIEIYCHTDKVLLALQIIKNKSVNEE
ncbi:MAG: DUF2007 domain-containing protein [Bacteroidetes bacterium]|nr:MAG: DUF2007 domain-containing protein [Bacteroidota bacterium]